MFWFEREPLHPHLLDWETSDRVHVWADDDHPWGASSHQKIVIVDEQLAFIGGIDLTQRRWECRGHPADEPLRVTPGGDPYPPFHDVQLMLTGPVVAEFGELFRTRWETVSKEPLRSGRASHDLWPDNVGRCLKG